MSLLTLFGIIIVVGVLLWAANAYLPMEARVRSILNITAIIVLILVILRALGVWQYLAGVHL